VHDGAKIVAKNRRARHDYHVVDSIEAGIALRGTEVKSVRQGKIQLAESFAKIEDGEAFLHGAHISPYEEGGRYNVDPRRRRKLLLRKREIMRLERQVREKGMTLVPLSAYLRRGRVKIEIGICRGKREYDKRRDIAKRDAEREIDRAMKNRRKEGDGG
jgi:SsrA-binding protein